MANPTVDLTLGETRTRLSRAAWHLVASAFGISGTVAAALLFLAQLLS